jgi:hypothetical protein
MFEFMFGDAHVKKLGIDLLILSTSATSHPQLAREGRAALAQGGAHHCGPRLTGEGRALLRQSHGT